MYEVEPISQRQLFREDHRYESLAIVLAATRGMSTMAKIVDLSGAPMVSTIHAHSCRFSTVNLIFLL